MDYSLSDKAGYSNRRCEWSAQIIHNGSFHNKHPSPCLDEPGRSNASLFIGPHPLQSFSAVKFLLL
jgi:hypothetical protein